MPARFCFCVMVLKISQRGGDFGDTRSCTRKTRSHRGVHFLRYWLSDSPPLVCVAGRILAGFLQPARLSGRCQKSTAAPAFHTISLFAAVLFMAAAWFYKKHFALP